MKGERCQAPHLLLKTFLLSGICFRVLLLVPEHRISQSEMSPVTLIYTEVPAGQSLELPLYFDFPQINPKL